MPFAGLATLKFGAELLPATVGLGGLKNFVAAKAFHWSGKKIQRQLQPRPDQP